MRNRRRRRRERENEDQKTGHAYFEVIFQPSKFVRPSDLGGYPRTWNSRHFIGISQVKKKRKASRFSNFLIR